MAQKWNFCSFRTRPCWLIWLVVVARGLYLARHLFTLWQMLLKFSTFLLDLPIIKEVTFSRTFKKTYILFSYMQWTSTDQEKRFIEGRILFMLFSWFMITSITAPKGRHRFRTDICETKINPTLKNSVDKSITSGSVQLLVMSVLVLSWVPQRSTDHSSPGGSSTGALN